ncbi:phospholipase [Mycobacterium sp. CBMA293]|uniref:patatin-like phospholipase family protein n=1 Tax=unclassified Mycolicibacterium TaxID=2636767 RepID=UPI0012DFE203|nr:MULTISPECIES: patatin-like phospholipase family protein [unclassified Mycolicibacterium]MUL47877.1 phospholipase [Mycolicibacterium sp. CBMA 360]MUL59275.1 phospholipase [Mycolicibacterium sp. CBMA 335]MUL71000.1 phospholipase [Mycolicibacterium sp. CBMA 311]MUL94643.1 phospholipase [Mycolicibacterium sp. CBMA 230]MUM09179.1 phospholipase [Mycolicibacterium sp. CBMA 213]
MAHRPDTSTAVPVKTADLVLSGGGVKGIGLVGAVVALNDAGYHVGRVSGTSAGSLVGAVIAAANRRQPAGSQLSGDQLRDLAMSLPYRKFLDPVRTSRIPVLGKFWTAFHGQGMYRGDFIHDWIDGELRNLGVRTFGDLALDDRELPLEQRYRLVVTVADVTRGTLVRLPWDYRRTYGLDPDEQPVADAVSASMAIPFFFRPVTITGAAGRTSTLIDGGLLSNFPMYSLDRTDGKVPRWPSFGITVTAQRAAEGDGDPSLAPLIDLPGAPRLLENLINTALLGHDQTYLRQPSVAARTIVVDAAGIGYLNFEISQADRQTLYDNGYSAAKQFLSTWDWQAYLHRFHAGST